MLSAALCACVADLPERHGINRIALMINRIIAFSIKNKFIVGLFTLALIGMGIYSMSKVPLGAVPDITNNQVQVITTSPNLGTSDIEQFVTYPVELAMANLPGVIEIRSISRFGLSVVTIVFEEDMGTYLPRQLVSEKLSEVREEIPQKFGQPSMGPISTGLGEVYQYFLTVEPEYDSLYNDRKLRTIQDWIVKRQMAMLPGVVEVNSFGGHIKQYEVALNPNRLKSMGLTIAEVFHAIEKNNGNTGGAYIEKDHQANFIRGEGLAESLADLGNIVVKTTDGIPILVKDVAEVTFGSAVRYGAFTKDGQGEAVGGIVMMLKGAHPNEVVKSIKERMVQIEKSLPPGVHIEPFLDRSELIGRTTGTISKNLIEGALIVIFVLVLLLGNFRGGLIVASVIPLSLLFAFIMMHIFNVSANLMSLGAIDFGILVDGAVIIVEGVVHLMDKHIMRQPGRRLAAGKMDEITYTSGSKMMNSAFFGQLIILIVFFPILSLTGIEGKMFRPMALTFSFAVLGAMILCLTYVPMVTALFLGHKAGGKNIFEKLSQKIIGGAERLYDPLLRWALESWKWVLAIAVIFLLVAAFTFTRLGAVFIPNLDEGDIAMQALLKPGSALSETVAASNKIEKILLEKFPEINHVVARIGVSEIPTDPMPMDVADMFILLKPRDQWTSASTKEALIAKIKEAVSVVPGINYQFSQPVELRFNELLTGVREDIAIKIYGDDLDILAQKANELAGLIQNVEGIGDLKVEATRGLPQVTIDYEAEKLAQYGLNVEDLNTLVETAFGGKAAGQVFEGEKRFDIVLRLQDEYRQNIDDIKNLYVQTPVDGQIPLKEVATISYQPGPMQISRDGTKRRIYVGINIRGRDVESLVNDIQQKLDEQLRLPPGYYLTYGGEFENLQRAKQRLGIVVPIALALIFLLLYFALNSFKQSIMIYVAIPLAAIGGIFSLYFRGIPFSISAGVGFIVLFGVAVLNGLVLINSLNELKAAGVLDLKDRIRQGTKQRLRPILLTAVAAIMGFTPMAFSTSAGAEVQRPLATVVIGGLITATLLTLLVIPVLYYLMERKAKQGGSGPGAAVTMGIVGVALLLGGLTLFPAKGLAQSSARSDTLVVSSVRQAAALAMENNPGTKAAELGVMQRRQLQKTAFNLPKTSVYYGQEETGNNVPGIQSVGFTQQFAFPTVYGKRAELLRAQTDLAENARAITRNQLLRAVRLAYYHLQNAYQSFAVYSALDSFYGRFYAAAALRFETGETNKLEMMAAQGRQAEIRLKKQQSLSDIRAFRQELASLMNAGKPVAITRVEAAKAILQRSVADTGSLRATPFYQYRQQQVAVARSRRELEKTSLLPSFNAGYAVQRVNGEPGFHSFQVGIGIPLWFRPRQGRIQAAETQIAIREKQFEQQRLKRVSRFKKLMERYRQTTAALQYYDTQGRQIAEEILRNNTMAFRKGAIGYVEYLQNVNSAISLKQDYLRYLNRYNETVIELNYLLGE